MADNGFKVNKSINLNPQEGAPTGLVTGDMYYDSSLGTFVYCGAGNTLACMDSIGIAGSSASITGSTMTPAVMKNSLVRLTGFSGNLYGMSASFAGKRVTLYNNTSGTLTIYPNNTNEPTTNNRIVTPTANSMQLIAGEIAQFVYDGMYLRWLLVSVGSGAGAYLPATTTYRGAVQLNAAPVDALSPIISVVDANGLVIGTGLTRGTLTPGWITVANGANDWGLLTNKFAIGQIQPLVTTYLGACQLKIGAPDTYDSGYYSLVNLQGAKNGYNIARGFVGSAPVRFTNTGNYDTGGIGHGLITEWYAVNNSGLTQVASLNTTGALTISGQLQVNTISCTNGLSASTGSFTSTLSTRHVNIASGYNLTLANGSITCTLGTITCAGNMQGAILKATNKFQYTNNQNLTKFYSAPLLQSSTATFIVNGTRSYWTDLGAGSTHYIALNAQIPKGATLAGLKIYGFTSGTVRPLTVYVNRVNGGSTTSVYSSSPTDSLPTGSYTSIDCTSGTWNVVPWSTAGDYFSITISWTANTGNTTAIFGAEVTYNMTDLTPSV
jgi:hypothetical protein